MNQLEKQVLRIIGESVSSPDVFKDTDSGMAPIRDSVNDAIQEILGLTGGYEETFHVPLTADTSFYRLTFQNADLGWITDAWLVGQDRRLAQTDLYQMNALDPRWMVRTGTPEAYMQIGDDIIGFSPKSSSASDVVELTCAVIPGAYVKDFDRVKLKDSFRWAVVNFAVSEYWAGRGDAVSADDHYAIYLGELGNRLSHRYFADRVRQFATTKTTPQEPSGVVSQ